MKGLQVLALAFAACSTPLRAEDPVWNKQACDHCKMLLSDKRYAASLIDDAGHRLFFDDIGCLVSFELEHRGPRAHWVKDEASGAWIEADQAFFRVGAATPMDFGYSAHAAAPGLRYDEVRRALQARTEHAHADH